MNKYLTLSVLLYSCVSASHAAGKKRPSLPNHPANARIISTQDFAKLVAAGQIVPITGTPRSVIPPLPQLTDSAALALNKDGIIADFQNRFPEKRRLLKKDLPAQRSIKIHNSSDIVQEINLLGTDFAIATLAETIQRRTSPFNENLIAYNLQQLSPTRLTQFDAPQLRPVCSDEIGYKQGLDLGKLEEKTASSIGLTENFTWPLKGYTTCIKDQGRRGSCTAFAVLSAIETSLAVEEHKWLNLSEQALYNQVKLFWANDYIPTPPSLSNTEEDGSVTSDILNFSKKYNYHFPLESAWEYNPATQIQVQPDPKDSTKQSLLSSCNGYAGICSNTIHQGDYVCALENNHADFQCGYSTPITAGLKSARIQDFAELWNLSDPVGSLNLMISFLNSNKPLIASLAVTNRFLAVRDGFADVSEMNPDPSNPDMILGYHAVEVVGYISRPQILQKLPNAPLNLAKSSHDSPLSGYFIIKNQWGTKWGDAGYVYLPGDYLANNLLAIQSLSGVELVGF